MPKQGRHPLLGFWRKKFKGKAKLAGTVCLGERRQWL
jgi:hypothetical protein